VAVFQNVRTITGDAPLDGGKDRDLSGHHRHITTVQIYDKRRRRTGFKPAAPGPPQAERQRM